MDPSDRPTDLPPSGRSRTDLAPWARHALALGACVLTTVVSAPLHERLDPANTVMLFLLTVMLVAVKLGRNPAILAAFSSVALFDFFFVPPRFSFTVNDVQYLMTFAVMLAVALIVSHLASGLERQAREAERRERQTRALYQVAKTLAGSASAAQVVSTVRAWLRANTGTDALLLVTAENSTALLPVDDRGPAPSWLLERAARTAAAAASPFETGQLGDDRRWLFLPLQSADRTHGVLAVEASTTQVLKDQRAVLQALASLVAATLERLHYVEVAQTAHMQAASERLRSSILSAISHDVRTPLTALYGLADALTLARPALPAAARETAAAIRDQAQRLNGMVSNLLDMARLRTGSIALRKEWQPLEEVIGAAIQSLGAALRDHPVQVDLPPELPLLEFDAVLMERVFANLLDNAAKYSPPGASIAVRARLLPDHCEVLACDGGSGFPADRLQHVFELFARASPESSVPGFGVGLAICRAIVEAHGGRIRAFNLEGGGACVAFTLPLGEPPAVDAEADGASARQG